MNNFRFEIIHGIMVVKVDLIVATFRDAEPFWEELEENLIFDQEKVIIDLSSCTYIDSTFTGMLIRTYKKVIKNNNRLRIVYPQRNSVINLWVLGLMKFIKCFDSLQQAADSLEPKRINWSSYFNEEFFRN